MLYQINNFKVKSQPYIYTVWVCNYWSYSIQCLHSYCLMSRDGRSRSNLGWLTCWVAIRFLQWHISQVWNSLFDIFSWFWLCSSLWIEETLFNLWQFYLWLYSFTKYVLNTGQPDYSFHVCHTDVTLVLSLKVICSKNYFQWWNRLIHFSFIHRLLLLYS